MSRFSLVTMETISTCGFDVSVWPKLWLCKLSLSFLLMSRSSQNDESVNCSCLCFWFAGLPQAVTCKLFLSGVLMCRFSPDCVNCFYLWFWCVDLSQAVTVSSVSICGLMCRSIPGCDCVNCFYLWFWFPGVAEAVIVYTVSLCGFDVSV